VARDLEVKPAEIVDDKKDDAPKKGTALVADKKGLSDEELQKLVFSWASDAHNFIEEFLTEKREHATLYYKGNLPDVDEDDANEDRSTAVMSEVRDTVLGIMPDLLRIFFQADGVVKYNPAPTSDPNAFAQKDAEAKQATDYIRQVVLKVDNPDFFLTMHDAFQDALVRKTGLVKWGWEKSKKPKYSSHTGLTEDMVMALAADPDVTVLGKREYMCALPGMDGSTGTSIKCYDLKLRRTEEYGRARIWAIPCENIIIARRGRSLERTSLFGYTEDKKVGDFLAEGLIEDAAELADCDRDPNDSDGIEAVARRPGENFGGGDPDEATEDPSQRVVKYGELYITADKDGDGIPELLRVITAGLQYKVLQVEPVDEVQYAAFCPFPEAHQFFGESIADLTQDIQRIKSRILRDVLDSLAQSVQPSLGVVEGQVNLDDVLNPDTSKVMRQRAPGMIQPIVIPFVGKEALPVLDLMSKARENRTGQSDAASGLDPAVLQSSTHDAVHATLSKSQSRVEMIARIFAETGMTRLFRGLLKLIIRNMDKPRTVRLAKEFVTVDPQHWNAEMDVEVTLALGRGSQTDQISVLTQILGKQQELLMTLGFDNPIVSLDQYCYTLGRLVETAGWQNAESFFGDTAKLDPQTKAAAVQKMTQAMAAKAGAGKTGPDPAIEQAKNASNEKIETMKATANQQVEQAKMTLAAAKLKGELMLQAMKQRADAHIEMMKLAASTQSEQHDARLSAMVEHAGNAMDAHVTHIGNHLDAAAKVKIAEMKPEPKGDE
jgi:hypothetical protein